jgi:hypothetical protein
MRVMRLFAATALAVAGLITISCGGIVDPSKNTVDTFTGTIAVGGSAVHPFSASKTGEISVKVTSLAPVQNTFVGLIWAQAANDGSCSATSVGGVYQQNNFAQQNVPAISGSILQGRYCLHVYDVGAFTATETYTVTVSHP